MRFVDFYFDFSSTNSYFAAFLLPEICARNEARVNWMPTHFAALFRGTGFDVMAMTRRKARYLWRDHARYAEAQPDSGPCHPFQHLAQHARNRSAHRWRTSGDLRARIPSVEPYCQ